jgi:hypothetical protein
MNVLIPDDILQASKMTEAEVTYSTPSLMPCGTLARIGDPDFSQAKKYS